jgi:hypothetical protein
MKNLRLAIALSVFVSGLCAEAQVVSANLTVDQLNLIMYNPCEGVSESTSFYFPTLETEIDLWLEAWSPCEDANVSYGSSWFFYGLLRFSASQNSMEFTNESATLANGFGTGFQLSEVVSVLGDGHEIGPMSSFSSAGVSNGLIYHSGLFSIDPYIGLTYFGNGGYHNWASQTSPSASLFAGFRMTIDGNLHYGYIEMGLTAYMPGFVVNIEGVYLNQSPDTPILAGEQAACLTDITGDGLSDVNDFLSLNTAFGSACVSCPEDISGDSLVDINDFLMLNSAFGQPCD